MKNWTSLQKVLTRFDQMGWLLGTSGNFSVREVEKFFLSASGLRKGEMSESDFLPALVDGPWPPEGLTQKPSAEGSLHQVIYQARPRAAAVVHGHSPAATLASRIAKSQKGHLPLPVIEMLKGFSGIDPHQPQTLPIFSNHPRVEEIAMDFYVLLENGNPPPAMLIEGHGLTAWGDDPDEACRHFEIAEFFCRYFLESHRLNLEGE